MLEFAVARKLIQINPARGVKLFKPQRRERFLTQAEVTQIADTIVAMEAENTINPNFAAAIRLLLLTGCRKSEILNLKWAWVDFERKCLRLPRFEDRREGRAFTGRGIGHPLRTRQDRANGCCRRLMERDPLVGFRKPGRKCGERPISQTSESMISGIAMRASQSPMAQPFL